jgi:SNF2 family DNA or RNA helicase
MLQQNFQARFKWPEEEYVLRWLLSNYDFNYYPSLLYSPQFIDFLMQLKILADAMGLGKTIMTISLLAHSKRGGSTGSQPMSQPSSEGSEVSSMIDGWTDHSKKQTKLSGFDKLMKQKSALMDGGNLIVCPMTLLGQWKVFVLQFLFTVCSSAYLS